MIGVPHDSPRGREMIADGPAFREDPAYWREEPPWCDQCHGHRSECAFCGHEGDGRCDGEPYPADLAALGDPEDAMNRAIVDKLPMFPTSAQAAATGRCVHCLTPLPAANPRCIGQSQGHSPGIAAASSRAQSPPALDDQDAGGEGS